MIGELANSLEIVSEFSRKAGQGLEHIIDRGIQLISDEPWPHP